jgi:hypothetical protein
MTVTDAKLAYRTRHLTFDQLDLRLGSSRIGSLDHHPDGWQSLIGARRCRYAESHWFGNPGCYEVFIVGLNDAGAGHFERPADYRPLVAGRLDREQGYKPTSFDPLPASLRAQRDLTTANTLTILGPAAAAELADLAPVDQDRVRLLRDERTARRNRRWLRRLMRDAARQLPTLPTDPADVPGNPGQAEA